MSFHLSPSHLGVLVGLVMMPLAACSATDLSSTAPTDPTTTTPASTAPAASNGALANVRLFVNPQSPAATQASAWQSSRPTDAALMRYIAAQPTATWFGDWNTSITSDVRAMVQRASAAGTVPVLVAYNIPNRDCGSYSAGGASGASAYASWIQGFANGISGSTAVVVLEPDAVASDCASTARYAMLANAVKVLKASGARVYLDAGNPNWVSASEMAGRLQQSGIAQADGFSLNVSNFYSTSSNISYGNQLSGQLGGKHYVIDTSRNGLGSSSAQWCNPSGMALGNAPTTSTGSAKVDAFLWIKVPGESDGTCNGGPAAGQWWADYALGLAQRANVSA
jgi:endoglucanase